MFRFLSCCRRSWSPLGLLVVLIGTTPLLATSQRGSALAEPRRAQAVIARELLAGSPEVRLAFREVVAEARRSTVRVRCHGKDAALGCIVRSDGYIITKASLLEGSITCRLFDGRELAATLVEVDHNFDLAILKIQANRLPTAAWSAAPLTVGQWVATPGLGAIPRAIGVVSVLEREIPKTSGRLGIILDPGTDVPGPRVAQVVPHSPAAAAGIQVNDIITQCNGIATPHQRALIARVQGYAPGDEIELTIQRDGEQHQLKARLADPASLQAGGPDSHELQNNLGSELSERRHGFPKALQHDTVLHPTDCGGPLIDLDGKVVGINLARGGRTESYAASAEIVKSLLEKFMAGKSAVN